MAKRSSQSKAAELQALIEKGRRKKQLDEAEVMALFDDPEGEDALEFLEQLEANQIELITSDEVDDEDDLDDDLLDLDEDDLDDLPDDLGEDDDDGEDILPR